MPSELLPARPPTSEQTFSSNNKNKNINKNRDKRIPLPSYRHCLCVFLFYTLFYTALISFTAGLLIIHTWYIIDYNRPWLTGTESCLIAQPGISMVPVTDVRETLVKYKNGHPYSYLVYHDTLIAFMQRYDHPGRTPGSLRDCNMSGKTDPSVNLFLTSCIFHSHWAYRCNAERKFGYEDNSPCFIITLNKIYGWLPDIARNQSGVSVCCGGATPFDEELMGSVCLYDALVHDERGCDRRCGTFPHQYFPYLNQIQYQSPLVFLELRQPKRNVVIRIRCDLQDVPGGHSVGFELLID